MFEPLFIADLMLAIAAICRCRKIDALSFNGRFPGPQIQNFHQSQ